MSEINDRIKQVREAVGLKIVPFADKIGYTNGTISQIERGLVKVERRLVVAICLAFNVREEWIMTGEGDMFKPPEPMSDEELLLVLRDKYDLNDESLYIISGFLRLPSEEKNNLAAIVHRIATGGLPVPGSFLKNPQSIPQADPQNLRKTG